MSETLDSPTFVAFAVVAVSLAISVASAWAALKLWSDRLKQPGRSEKLSAEGFRSPVNLSVSVTGIVVPVAGGVFALLKAHGASGYSVGLIVGSVFVLLLAIFNGLVLSFALATGADEAGHITITAERFVGLPAQLTFQFSMLFLGLVALVAGALASPMPWQVTTQSAHAKPNACDCSLALRTEQ